MIDPNLITTVRVGELPANNITLESKISHEIGADLNQATIQSLITFLQPYIGTFQFEVKQLDVTTQYITDNFDNTGLGTNLMVGWAICNGANGTHNFDGRVGVAYGTTKNVMGQIGGATTHALLANEIPPIQVPYTGSNDDNGGEGIYIVNSGAQPNTLKYLVSTGTGTAHNIMQPYIVQLFIMKL